MIGITIGAFDGIHLAHQQIIKSLQQKVKKSILISFDQNPKVFFNKSTNFLLTTNTEKFEILSKLFPSLQIETLIFKKFYQLEPEEFIKHLKNIYDFDILEVGYDFKFGYQAKGNIKILRELQKKYKFQLFIQKPIKYKNKILHSSLIRKYLTETPSKLEDVKNMLNRLYSITGLVIEGQKIGRKIGFPTANILVNEHKLLPYFGIYKANVYILDNEFENNIFEGLLYIGPRPVINNYQISTEVWIKDFNRDIYYKPIKVEVVKFLRKIKKFKTLQALVKQMEKDVYCMMHS